MDKSKTTTTKLVIKLSLNQPHNMYTMIADILNTRWKKVMYDLLQNKFLMKVNRKETYHLNFTLFCQYLLLQKPACHHLEVVPKYNDFISYVKTWHIKVLTVAITEEYNGNRKQLILFSCAT